MNVALRLLMRAKRAEISPTRYKFVTGTSLTTTATFDEGTALGSTYLLFAIVHFQSSGTITPDGGWTEASGGGSQGSSTQVRMYARQGNGSVNSFTVTKASGSQAMSVYLFAFPGFVSATALGSAGSGGFNSGTYTITPTTGLGTGVTFVCLGTGGSSAPWGSWSDGYATPTSTASNNRAGWDDGDGASTITWTLGSDTNRRMWCRMPLS